MSDNNDEQKSTIDGENLNFSNSPSDSSQNLPNLLQMRQQRSPWQIVKSFCLRLLMIYLVMRFVRQPTNRETKLNRNSTHSVDPHRTYKLKNLYEPADLIDVYIFINDEELYEYRADENEICKFEALKYVDWTEAGSSSKSVEILNSPKNGSIYLHVVVTKHGVSIEPQEKRHEVADWTFSVSQRLSKYKRMNSVEIESVWHPEIRIEFLDERISWRRGHVPPLIDKYLRFENLTGKFYPIVLINDFWNLDSDYEPIDFGVEKLKLKIRIEPIELWKWKLFVAQNFTADRFSKIFLSDQDEDQDALKRVFLETNFYLLLSSSFLTSLKFLLPFFGMNKDIRKEKNRENFDLSSILRIVQSFVGFLHVVDRRGNTLLRIVVFIAFLREIFGIRKIFSVQRENQEKIFSVLPKLRISIGKSFGNSELADFDQNLSKRLRRICFSLLLIFIVCQWFVAVERNIYSFVLIAMYEVFLTIDFMTMTSEILENHKLKSVGYFPRRSLIENGLKSVTDDLFGFAVRAPPIYLLASFRDDLIFLIILFQRQIYPVDRKRFNEFVQSEEKQKSA